MTDHDLAIQRLSTEMPAYADRTGGTLEQVRRVDEEQQTRVPEQLRVHPTWYDSHDQIPRSSTGFPEGVETEPCLIHAS